MLLLPVSCFCLAPVPSSMDTSKLLDLRFFRRLLFCSALAELLLFHFSSSDGSSLVDEGILVGISSSGFLLISCAEEAREEIIDIRSVLEQTMPVEEGGLGGGAVDDGVDRGTCSEARRLGCCVGCAGTKSE